MHHIDLTRFNFFCHTIICFIRDTLVRPNTFLGALGLADVSSIHGHGNFSRGGAGPLISSRGGARFFDLGGGQGGAP